MQSQREITKRSPNKIIFPFDSSTRKNERQVPSGNPSKLADSPVASNQNFASTSEIQHVGFCSLGDPTNAKHIFKGIGEVSVMTTEDSRRLPASAPINCNCAAIRRYASMIQSPSDDEIAIIYLALLVGWDNAEQIAPRMGFRSNRSLRTLLTSTKK
jgi:hypothetical protein